MMSTPSASKDVAGMGGEAPESRSFKATSQGNRMDRFWNVRLKGEEEDDDGSIWTNGVWGASTGALDLREREDESNADVKREDIPGVSGAFLLHNVLSNAECDMVVDLTEDMGYVEFDLKKNTHAAVTWVASKAAVVKPMFDRIKTLVPGMLPSADYETERELVGLNARLRCYRYQPDGAQTFRKHMDDSFPSQGLEVTDGNTFVWDDSEGTHASMLTFLLYLTDDFNGGHTVFHPHEAGIGGSKGVRSSVSVAPVKGSALCFYQTQNLGYEDDEVPFALAPLHEGSILSGGNVPKYVVRSDILYTV